MALMLLLTFSGGVQAVGKAVAEVVSESHWDPGLRFATDLCVDRPGRVWIADGLNRRLVLLDTKGGTRTVACDSFARPMGVDAFKGNIYVTDTGRHSIHVLNSNGAWKREIRLPALCDPVDVLVQDEGLVVADNDNHRLLLLTPDGRLARVLGKGGRKLDKPVKLGATTLKKGEEGTLVGEFTYPGLLSRSGNGFLAVDVLGARIQVFSPTGRFDRLIGGFSTDGTGVFRPKGVCAFGKGDGALVADGYTGLIMVFDELGDPVGRVTKGGNAWRLNAPTSIQQDGEHLWVLDARANRVYRILVK